MSLANPTERTVCNRYRLTEVLGRGGMGVVWRARDERLQRDVAVKEVELPTTLPQEVRASANERALREARAAARLSHAAAVTIFDVQEEDGRAYLVMELVDAPTLGDVLQSHGPLPPERTAEIGLQVLDALEAAHASGIVHRDVKPANVMIPAEGTAKLADFGIASLKDDPKITQTGHILGSPSYMAPEQAEGKGSGPEADLWALGATLYYAVEGEPPFDAGQAIPTLAAVLHDAPRPMERAGTLEPVITALLAKDPARRPSGPEVRRMLDDVVRGRAVTSMPVPPERRTVTEPEPEPAAVPYEPEPRRRTGLVVLAALAALLLLGVGAWALIGGGDEEPERTVAGERARGDNSNRGSGDGSGSEDSSGPGDGSDTVTDTDTDTDTDTSTGTAPEGWTTYENPSVGWSIAYPEGWEVSEDSIGDGSSTDISDPLTGAYLRIDWQSPPGPSAVGAWEDQEQSFSADHEGYQRIALEPTTFRDYEAATWEFTWDEGGTTLHAVDLGFIVEDDYGFALNFVAPESEWADLQDEFATFQETYTPPS